MPHKSDMYLSGSTFILRMFAEHLLYPHAGDLAVSDKPCFYKTDTTEAVQAMAQVKQHSTALQADVSLRPRSEASQRKWGLRSIQKQKGMDKGTIPEHF